MKKIFILLVILSPLITNPYSFDFQNNTTTQQVKYSCGLEDFKNTLGFVESTNNYKCVNKWGYLGKYQFSRRTLKGLGFKVKKREFLNSPSIQEEALIALLNCNKKILQKEIDKYEGIYINGIYVTESGLLASAHLLGPNAVKKYLKSNGRKIKKDGLGTSIEKYLKLFSGYSLYL